MKFLAFHYKANFPFLIPWWPKELLTALTTASTAYSMLLKL
jgi:hypothetical protein